MNKTVNSEIKMKQDKLFSFFLVVILANIVINTFILENRFSPIFSAVAAVVYLSLHYRLAKQLVKKEV